MTHLEMATHLLDNLRAIGVDAYRDVYDYVLLVDIDATHRATILVYDSGAVQLDIFTLDVDGEPYADEVIDHPITYRDADTIARLIGSYR